MVGEGRREEDVMENVRTKWMHHVAGKIDMNELGVIE